MSRYLLLAALAVAAVLMVGCGDSDPDTSSTPTAPGTTSSAGAIRCPSSDARGLDTSELIGLSLEDAEARAKRDGCTVRVVEREAKPLPVTMDFNAERVNVAVTDGKVTAIRSVG